MSLFKPLKGDSSRISMDITPFHDGWCYFTTDDGGFYIDSIGEDGTQKRTRVGGSIFTKTFDAASWTNGKITIPASEHKLEMKDDRVLTKVYMLKNNEYTDNILAVMDTEVSTDVNKNVVLSYSGTGYAGKVILCG